MTTPTLARCELTELLVEQCAHCRGLDDPETPDVVKSRPFTAAYSGDCHWCGRRYSEGDRIRRIHDDDGPGYLGPCCKEDR